MREKGLDSEARFAAVVRKFRGAANVTPPEGGAGPHMRFGSNGLKVDGKIFAMLVNGRLVVKLPRERVQDLVSSGAGGPFDPGHGRLMKEWIVVAPDSTLDWYLVARDALEFVSARPK